MKKRVYIIHGWGFNADEKWYPWLKRELEAKGFDVFAPQMPNTNEPVIEEWVTYLAKLVGTPDKQTYFMGHSIGCQAIMRYLQTIDTKIGGAVFIAGWVVLHNLEDEEIPIAKPWIETPLDFEKLKTLTKNYSLIISDNDPFGRFEENEVAFEKLGAKIIVLKNAGHIEDAELPVALEKILKYSK